MNPNTGGPASEKTLLDEFAGRALTGYRSQATGNDFNLASECYDDAEAMLAEKARRETQPTERISIGSDDKRKALEALKLIENIDHPEFAAVRLAIANLASRFEVSKEADLEFSTTDHFRDAAKMIPDPFAEDTLRRLAADVLPADIKDAAKEERLMWCAEQVRARVNTLEALNRELVNALEKFIEAGFGFSTSPAMRAEAYNKACEILAKAKEVA